MCTNYLLDTNLRPEDFGGAWQKAELSSSSRTTSRTSHLRSPPRLSPLAACSGRKRAGFWPTLLPFFPLVRGGGWRLAGFNGAEASQAANTCVFRRGRPCSLWTSQTSCVSASRVTTTEKVKVSGLGTFHLPRCVELLLIETEQLTLKVSHPRAMRAFRWSPVMSLTC